MRRPRRHCRTITPIAGRGLRSGSIRTSRESRHSAAREARARNPYSRWWLWIPGPRLATCSGMMSGEIASARGHSGADLGAQLVDQLEAALGLDMPEGPAVAGLRSLRDRAHAVDRADLVAEHDGAVGAHQGAMPLPGVDQPRA